MSTTATLLARDLAKAHAGRPVFDGITFSASPGERIGLVGENGVGKSTLLRLLAGLEEPDSGTVGRPPACGYLHQELPFRPQARVQDVVDDALAEHRAAKARLDALATLMRDGPEDAAVLSEYGELLGWAEDNGSWDADRRAEIVCAGLGLGALDPARPLETLSGGQRSRLALAALLIRQPEAMLLDEPTNHLDDESTAFLEHCLARLPGAVVLASHDRAFLNAVCTGILDLDPSRAGPTRYTGAYDAYREAKRLERLRWEQAHAAEEAELADLRRSVDVTARAINHARPMKDANKLAFDRSAGRVQRQVSRRVRNARNRLDELARSRMARPPDPLRFAAPLTSVPDSERVALGLRDVRVEGRLAIARLDLAASARLLITGPNGAGKSTLLQLMAGRLEPDSGEIRRRPGVRVGLLEQDVAFSEPWRSAAELYARVAGVDAPQLAHLGLLPVPDLDRPVGDLSVGQRRRVALALVVAQPPEILLLDEPTNHLSLGLVEDLEEALTTAPGAVVVASHDRWLRRNWAGPELALAQGEAAVRDTA